MTIDVAALKARVDIVAVVSAYTKLKKIGQEFCGPCPIHGGDGDNFFVSPQKGIWACFSHGCHEEGEEGNDVIGFVRKIEGLTFQQACERLGATDWKPIAPIRQAAKPLPDRVTSKPPADAPVPSMSTQELGEPVKTWCYRDTDGGVLGYVARYEVEGRKEIRCWSWGARGSAKPSFSCGHWTQPRPIYALDRLADHPDRPVLVVEGEKAAEAAQALLSAYVVTTWPAGANSWHKAEWSPLKGRKVLLWPDNDAPGVECMAKLAALLADPRGLACSVRIIDPSGMPDGFDAADWTGTTDELIAWAKPRASDYAAPQQQESSESQEPPQSDAEPPPVRDSDFPPGASPARPKRPRRPKLATVGGNAVPAEDPDAAPLPVSMSEDALAEHLAEEHGKDWRYVSRWGLWFKWCGDTWQEDQTNEIFSLGREICRASLYWPEAAPLSADGKRKIARKSTAGNVRDMAGADRRIAATTDQWDRDPWLLGVPGGVVDLHTGKLLEGEPEQYITKKCSVAPAEGPHHLFDSVLARACAEDPDMSPYLLRFFGYILTGDVREECFLFLHGPGGSGKGTLVKCIGDILGDYAKTISMEALVESKAQRHPQELAKLDRARFVYASETEEGRRWNESLIKWLTGRDKITAHFMRENDFEFYPQFKLLIYGNHIPHLKSVGEEMRRRVHLIEYAGSLAEEDRDTSLKDRLVAEYPAILHTLIQGCIEWQQCGLGRPERVSDATSSYLESEDTLGIWLEDNVERDTAARAQSGDVYQNFKRWAESSGEYVMSQKRFVQAMNARGFDSKRAGGKRYLEGLTLKTPPAYGPQPGRYQDD